MIFRAPRLKLLACAGAILVAGCAGGERDQARNLPALNVLDETGIADIMLTFADPSEAVNYFRRSLASEPNRIDFRRGLAVSLLRAQEAEESALIYAQMVEAGQATSADRLAYADALLRTGAWQDAEAQLDAIPPTVQTYNRYRLEAMVADYQKEWRRADSFYETARGLTTRPAAIYNNWGISKMARGDYTGAEALFRKAIGYNSKLFSAKNNMAIARARRKVYDLPVIPMTEIERAQLLHNIGLQAIRNGDVDLGRGLLEEAIDTHPQHFEAAVEKLDALTNTVTN